MFPFVILVLYFISMIESITCDISKEKATIYNMLQSIEKKTKECISNGNCPAGWKTYKDHCYFFSLDGKGWHDAAKQCTNMGGYLVKIEDSAENSWVVSKLNEGVKHVHGGSWMGLADFKNEGDWRWVHDSSKVGYSQWYPGEPNNAGNEDCVHFWAGAKYKWNDAPCKLDKMGYICECSHGPNCRPHNG